MPTPITRYPTLQILSRRGLWRHQGIGFSRQGSLKGTIATRVGQSLAGHTSKELEVQFKVPVQQTLTGLVRTGILTRDALTDVYVYLSGDPDCAKEQMTARCQGSLRLDP